MISRPSVDLERRDARLWLDELLRRRAGYTPEWLARPASPGAGLAAIGARYLEALAQRLNQAPDKMKTAFLDLAGLGLIAAQAARAPIVFQLGTKATGGSAPARTPIAAAPPPGSSEQILFETERSVGVTAGALSQVVSLWPGRDEYIDHSASLEAKEPIQPFAARLRQPTPHQLFLSHPVLLALAGNVELAVEFELQHGASSHLALIWEYWDGETWRGFLSTSDECRSELPDGADDAALPDLDSTDGLVQSGHYVLRADCATAVKTTVNGIDGFWLRARLTQPLPPDPTATLPEVDAIRLSSTVNRVLRGRIAVSEPGVPEPIQDEQGAVIVAATPTLGGVVRNAAGQPVEGAVVHLTDPADPTRVLSSSPASATGRYEIANVNFGRDYLYEVTFGGLRFSGPDAERAPRTSASAQRSAVDLSIAIEGLAPDKAFADATTLDVTKPFYPMGQQPQPGSAFYFTNEEAFSKPGAKVQIYVARTRSPQDEGTVSGARSLPHAVIWEYWNGRQWAPLPVTAATTTATPDLNEDEVISFTVPEDMEPLEVNGEEARWVRVRLQSGMYGIKQEITFKTDDPIVLLDQAPPPKPTTNTFSYVSAQPPVLAAFAIGYTWQYGPFHPVRVLAYNDFRYTDRTFDAIWPGTTFAPFERVRDLTPALYLGFDKQPPVDALGLFFEIDEAPGTTIGPALTWEYFDGFEWRRMPTDDETGHLRRPGIVTVVAQANDTAMARFGVALHWIRARLKEDGPPGEPIVRAVYANAVWASERHTIRDLPVGTSNGTPNQTFVLTQTPILPGEQIEVRELSGARANVEWRILAVELAGGDATVVGALEEQLAREGLTTDVVAGRLRLRRNRQKQVIEAWVTWESRAQLFFSLPGDRHYALDRASGRLQFGDGVTGRVPPAATAILVRGMTSGGGSKGNVPARAITQLLGVVPGIEAVFNPRAAEGGADGEALTAILDRGPRTIRHRGRAMLAADYETLAVEASPAVRIARAIPGRHPSGQRLPGWITLLIVPLSQERKPYPSFGLREHVRRFIERRAPLDLAGLGRIQVTGPAYLEIGVSATLAPIDVTEAGAAEKSARAALERFLHPLVGGPGGAGWDLGRDVYLSDIAAVLERTPGIDYVDDLALTLDGVPQGESVRVADEELVAAGAILLRLNEAER